METMRGLALGSVAVLDRSTPLLFAAVDDSRGCHPPCGTGSMTSAQMRVAHGFSSPSRSATTSSR